MADNRQLEILRKGPSAWNAWRAANEDRAYEHKRLADIIGALPEIDLSGADLSNLDLRKINFSCANLKRANLAGADLWGGDWSNADLTGASLVEAKLEHVKLYEACLEAADLSRAFISGVEMPDAYLAGTNFGEAHFDFARMGGAKLLHTDFRAAFLSAVEFDACEMAQVDFTRAVVEGCVFRNVDLREARGLATVRHRGPSSVDIETLFRSAGKIPQQFLRGCGVPTKFADAIPRLTSLPRDFDSCFISHSSKDRVFCDRLYNTLRRAGIRVWYFPESASWGKQVWSEIDSGVKSYDRMILVCSKYSLTSEPVLRELDRALAREDREHKDIVFPIRLDHFVFDSWRYSRRDDVARKVIGDFSSWRNKKAYRKSVNELLHQLERATGRALKALRRERTPAG